MANIRTSNGAPQASAEQQQDYLDWDEERILAAQRVLKVMYLQLRELRSTIPRLVAPLVKTHSSRLSPLAPSRARVAHSLFLAEDLYRDFSRAAATAGSEVREFRELYSSDESKELFAHVKESRARNPKDITPWRITQDPEWMKIDS